MRSTRPVELPRERALALWADVRRWPTFVEGFARVLQADPSWPEPGAKIVWESKPHGRGRVTERVVERTADRFATTIFEERLTGTQTAVHDGRALTVTLEYELTAGGPLRGLTDVLFIRRLLRQALERTLSRYALEAAEEASL